MLSGALQARADEVGAAACHVGAGSPIEAGGALFGVGGALSNRGEGGLRTGAVILAPGSKALNPVGQRGELAAAGLGERGDAAGIGVATGRVIHPRDPLPPFGERFGIEIDGAGVEQRFRAGGVVQLDQWRHCGRDLRGGGIGPGGAVTFADRRAGVPDHPLCGRQAGKVGGPAQLGEAGNLLGLRQFGRFAQQCH